MFRLLDHEPKSKEEAIEEARKFMELHRIHWPQWNGVTEVRAMYEEGEVPGECCRIPSRCKRGTTSSLPLLSEDPRRRTYRPNVLALIGHSKQITFVEERRTLTSRAILPSNCRIPHCQVPY